MKNHQDIDKRSLALHQLVVEKIRQNPHLFLQVQQNIQKFRTICAPATQHALMQWENLSFDTEKCLAVAVEDSEYAAALRQSSPFGKILTTQARRDFFRGWQEYAT